MTQKPDLKRIAIFIAIAYAIAWAAAIAIFLTGGLSRSPIVIPGTGFTLAVILLSTAYMWAPAVANVLTRVITREGWQDLYLGARWVESWMYLCAAWFVPTLLALVGGAVFFLLFPGYFDPTFRSAQVIIDQMAATTGRQVPLTAIDFVAVQVASAAFMAPLVNGISTIGEEFGWRGYLQPKLLPLGYRKSMILIGVIWGVWHFPLIAMGQNYGFGYAGYPWTGMLAMTWFTIQLGILLGWMTLRCKTIWPAVFGHGAINGIAAAPTLFYYGPHMPLLGPAMTGVITAIPMTLLSLYLLWKPGGSILESNNTEDPLTH